MSRERGTQPQQATDEFRYLTDVKLLGQDTTTQSKAAEYAIRVSLTDESQYTVYRTLKEIAQFHSTLISYFPVEAGYFNPADNAFEVCPVKKSILGITKSDQDETAFQKKLNKYLASFPTLPDSVIKSKIVQQFFNIRLKDRGLLSSVQQNRKKDKFALTASTIISGPLRLTSYYAVAPYTDPKTRLSLLVGSIVQVMQKERTGWWMVDAGSGSIGWVPASYLAPVEIGNKQEVLENETLVGPEEVGARYISTSDYKSTRDDEHSFVTGAVVKLVKKHIDGWWLARYNGEEKLVPVALFRKCGTRQCATYVQQIAKLYVTSNTVKTPRKIINKNRNHKKKETASGPSLVLYEAIADYEGERDKDQTTLIVGSRVKVLDKKEHGWWYVENGYGVEGWAPATFLKPILDPDLAKSPMTSLRDSPYHVITEYTATQPDELNLRVGDKVTVIEASQCGWWKVRHNKSAAIGFVPSICLKPYTKITENRTDERSNEGLEGATPPHMPILLDNITKDNEHGEEDGDCVGEEDGIVMEGCYIVVAKDFKARRFDEMDVKEGDVVCVLDDSQEDIWYVCLSEKEGWLPVSILVPINEKLNVADVSNAELKENVLSIIRERMFNVSVIAPPPMTIDALPSYNDSVGDSNS